MFSVADWDAIGDVFIVTNQTFNANAVWPTSNLAILVPFVVSYPTLVRSIVVNIGASSGNLDAGIYDADFTKVVSLGSTASPGTGVREFTALTDTTLMPGLYYMALAADNTTITFNRGAPLAQIVQAAGAVQMAAAFPLPTTITPAAASAYLPLIRLNTSTIAPS